VAARAARRDRVGGVRREREFFIDNLLVRIHFIIVLIWWTGLAPWELESPFTCSLTSTFLVGGGDVAARAARSDRVGGLATPLLFYYSQA